MLRTAEEQKRLLRAGRLSFTERQGEKSRQIRDAAAYKRIFVLLKFLLNSAHCLLFLIFYAAAGFA